MLIFQIKDCQEAGESKYEFRFVDKDDMRAPIFKSMSSIFLLVVEEF